MLIDFSVSNYRSYRRSQRFSLSASNQKDHSGNVIEIPTQKLSLLKSAVVYGANASGKSNLVKAMWALGALFQAAPRSFIDGYKYVPFALGTSGGALPMSFEINFLASYDGSPDPARYEYSLSLGADRVHSEWLNVYPADGRKQAWFVREFKKGHDVFEFPSALLKGPKKQAANLTAPLAPFLAVATVFNNPQLAVPAHWLGSNLSDVSTNSEASTAEQCHKNKAFTEKVVEFLKNADLGICGLRVLIEEVPIRIPSRIDAPAMSHLRYRPQLAHSTEDVEKPVPLPFADESDGTRRLFNLLYPWFSRLESGRMLIIDELATSIHPLLSRKLIELIHDPVTNPSHSQLVMTTHDVSLLSSRLFRRDQVWFTEKDRTGATELYSLYDYHPRTDEAFEKGYLAGRYGGIPYFGTLDWTFDHGSEEKEAEHTEGTGP